MKRKRGLAIGSYTSQPLGNFVISVIDHAMKERMKVKCYHRYCDDTVMLAKSKAESRVLLNEFDKMSFELGLVVKSSAFIAPIQICKNNGKKRKRQRSRKKDRLSGLSVHQRQDASSKVNEEKLRQTHQKGKK